MSTKNDVLAALQEIEDAADTIPDGSIEGVGSVETDLNDVESALEEAQSEINNARSNLEEIYSNGDYEASSNIGALVDDVRSVLDGLEPMPPRLLGNEIRRWEWEGKLYATYMIG